MTEENATSAEGYSDRATAIRELSKTVRELSSQIVGLKWSLADSRTFIKISEKLDKAQAHLDRLLKCL